MDLQPTSHTPAPRRKTNGWQVQNSPLVNSIVNQPPSNTDPQGMYTGKPVKENEVPVQDADDL